MKICGHRIREHIRLLAPLFGIIAAVCLLRLLADMAGVPRGVVRLFSVTGVCALCVLAAAVMIHRRRFGSYPNVVAASLLLVIWEQLLIVLAIAFAALTKTNNIFTAPEYSMPRNSTSHLKHIGGQLTVGVGVGALYGAAIGCLLLWILRALLPPTMPDRRARQDRFAVHR